LEAGGSGLVERQGALAASLPASTWRTLVRARCGLDRTVSTGMASARGTSW
jgi:hypothetical protein